jgi:two-component system sensor histidine kinase DegS
MDYEAPEARANPRQEIITMLMDEMTSIKRKLNEMRAQIESQNMMVNREQQHYSDLRGELQNIAHNLDTVPRQDIKEKYDETLNSSTKLLTMRGQLEKFQSNYETLEKEQQLLAGVLSRIQGFDVVLDAAEEDSPRTANVNIIRIVQAQEDERQRLGRQLHDGPAQSLTNFILQAEICQRLFDRNPERAAEELSNLKNAASVTFQKVREFIFDLRPMMLDDLGVIPTVRRYVTSFREKSDIQVDLEVLGEERRLENHREVMLFRGLQELMGHARDYANATQMQIRVDMAGKRVKILVQDNGRGFDADALSGDEDAHLDGRMQGLVTLKEKFELVDGSLQVSSSENEGTSIRLELPTGE